MQALVLSALTADFSHMVAILANLFAAFTAGFTGFFRSPFVGGAFFMGGSTAFAGNFPLFGRIHGSESAFVFRHGAALPPTMLSVSYGSVCFRLGNPPGAIIISQLDGIGNSTGGYIFGFLIKWYK
jgi:hypothetical protein